MIQFSETLSSIAALNFWQKEVYGKKCLVELIRILVENELIRILVVY